MALFISFLCAELKQSVPLSPLVRYVLHMRLLSFYIEVYVLESVFGGTSYMNCKPSCAS